MWNLRSTGIFEVAAIELKRDLAEERSGDLNGFFLEGVAVWWGGFGESFVAILFWGFRGGGAGGVGGDAVGFLISCVDVSERNDDGIFPIFWSFPFRFDRRKVLGFL